MKRTSFAKDRSRVARSVDAVGDWRSLVSVRVAETQANHVRAILAGRVAVAMAEAA